MIQATAQHSRDTSTQVKSTWLIATAPNTSELKLLTHRDMLFLCPTAVKIGKNHARGEYGYTQGQHRATAAEIQKTTLVVTTAIHPKNNSEGQTPSPREYQ